MRVLTGADALRHVLDGLTPLRRAIGASFGPDGRVCLLADGGADAAVLRTGADIARHMHDPAAPGSRVLGEALVAADRDLGDGTARLGIVIDAMLRDGARSVAAGVAADRLAGTLPGVVESFVERLAAAAEARGDLSAVGRTAGADPAVADALARLAADPGGCEVIEVMEGNEAEPRLERSEGFVLDAKPVGADLKPIPLHAPSVLVANEIIDEFGTLVPLIEAFAARGKPLVIVARGVTGTALEVLRANRDDLRSRIAAVAPVAAGGEAAEVIRDLAIATGAQMVCDREGTTLAGLRPAMLGRAAAFDCVAGRATFAMPEGGREAVAARCRALEAEATAKRYLALDRERLMRRAGRLSGKLGEIRLGGDGQQEGGLRRMQARRASASVLSARRGGGIPGGPAGLTLALPPDLDGDTPEAVAARCLAAAVLGLDRHLRSNAADTALPPRHAGAALAALRARPVAVALRDPLPLTAEIFRRAASVAATLLQTGAILCNSRP